MRSFYGNRFVDAIIKTIILIVLLHILIIAAGFVGGTTIGIAGLKVFWLHLTATSINNNVIALIGLVIAYIGVFQFLTKKQ
jgi:hypothetical protein